MNKYAPLPETKQSLARLAFAVAECLEDSSTPASLRDPLNEIASGLIDHLSGGSGAVELRALASFESGHSPVCVEQEKAPISQLSAKIGA